MNTETNINGNEGRLLAPVPLLGRADRECDIPGCQLRHEAEHNRQNERQQRDADGYPGTDSVWPAEPAGQLVLPEQAVPSALKVVPAGNPLAQLFVCLGAKLMRIGCVIHRNSVKRPNTQALPRGGAEKANHETKT